MRLDSLTGDVATLNSARLEWLNLAPVSRTLTSSSTNLALRDGAEIFDLLVPDLSGEEFKNQWKDRSWDISYTRSARDSSGLMLFLDPREGVEEARIEEADEVIEPAATGTADVEDWDPDKSSAQVRVVDVLQMHIMAKLARPIPIAVVISAWDLVQGEGLEPPNWLASHYPLVRQLLDNNSAIVRYSTFGVSAQGGDYSRDRVKLERVSHKRRAFCVGPDGRSLAISTPIAWLRKQDS
jgi:hypothetical protein